MLSDEWLPRYGLKQNLKWPDGNGNGNVNGNADAKVTTIALPVLCTGELKIKAIVIFKSTILLKDNRKASFIWNNRPEQLNNFNTNFADVIVSKHVTVDEKDVRKVSIFVPLIKAVSRNIRKS